MRDTPEQLFTEYDRHPGDRERMLRVVAEWWPYERVLYPGSYIDVSPSFVFPDVTYVDTDDRAARFFADRRGIDRLIRSRRAGAPATAWRFLHADYTARLDVPDASIDLVVSLYAGFVSAHCARYLRPGGCLLANDSHGDASLALLDPRYAFRAVVVRRESGYRVVERGLEKYVELHDPDREVTTESLMASGRGVRRRRPAAAYLFVRHDSADGDRADQPAPPRSD